MRAALDGQAKIVKALLKDGADVNAKDHEGRTALMFAAINSHRTTVKILLDQGADVNARAKDGGTALMLAACGDAIEIVQMLLDKGADGRGRFTETSGTALSIAKRHDRTKIVDLLKKATSKNRRAAVGPRDPGHDAHPSLISCRASAGRRSD
jgi:ankyrin repeat protein